WIEAARAACAARDRHALRVLGRYFGSWFPDSLHASLLSLVTECPAPRDPRSFIAWLETLDTAELVEVLLDQDDLAQGWPAVLAERHGEREKRPGALDQLVQHFTPEVRPTVEALLHDPEAARTELTAALHVWNTAVFSAERARVLPILASQVVALERQRAE